MASKFSKSFNFFLKSRSILNSSARFSETLTYHYLYKDLYKAASQKLNRTSVADMIKSSSKKEYLIENAKYLQKELPLRIAKRVVAFQNLPFMAASNPSLLRCQELYINAFQQLIDLPTVTDLKTEESFSLSLQELLDYHKEVVSLLSQGFREAGKYIENKQEITKFLNDLMKSRLGLRLLCDHHLQLPLERPGYVGSIELKFFPQNLILRKSKETKQQCDRKYGSSPEVKLVGHVDSCFMYIVPPLDYVLNEILKNAMRAVMESVNRSTCLPPVIITIVNNDTDFTFRISDSGDGIPHEMVSNIWQYGFTSLDHQGYQFNNNNNNNNNNNAFDIISENRTAGIMFGYGYGLPVCKAFIEKLGGSLSISTMQGIGTDVYIRLPHIEGKEGSVLI